MKQPSTHKRLWTYKHPRRRSNNLDLEEVEEKGQNTNFKVLWEGNKLGAEVNICKILTTLFIKRNYFSLHA